MPALLPLPEKRNLKIGQLLYGVATYVPGVAAIFGRGGGDTQSARYCYSVWLRHLVMAFASGLKKHRLSSPSSAPAIHWVSVWPRCSRGRRAITPSMSSRTPTSSVTAQCSRS